MSSPASFGVRSTLFTGVIPKKVGPYLVIELSGHWVIESLKAESSEVKA